MFILNWLRAASIKISGRNRDRVDDIVRKIGGTSTSLEIIGKEKPTANIIINTTPISSYDDSPEFADFIKNQDFRECELIIDLNYGRKQNIWQKKLLRSVSLLLTVLLRLPIQHAARFFSGQKLM